MSQNAAHNTSQPNIVQRLRATALDKDNFPRMNSERWLPVGLAKEAADRIEELEQIARQSKAAMLRTRTASIAGCEEGYGKPEKWADELFYSHGDLTASIKAIDAALPKQEPGT